MEQPSALGELCQSLGERTAGLIAFSSEAEV